MSVWVPGLLEVGTTSVSVSVLGVEYGGPGRWEGQDTRLACRPPPSPKSLWATTQGGIIIISTTHSLRGTVEDVALTCTPFLFIYLIKFNF